MLTDSERDAALAMMRDERAHEVARAGGRLLYRVEEGDVSWHVQAVDPAGAREAVRRSAAAEGWEPAELAVHVPLTWEQARRTLIRYESHDTPLVVFFTGLEDAVLACSEWDGD